MNEKDYCKFVFLGLINLLSLLFSIVIIISASNIKSKKNILVLQNPTCFDIEYLKGIIDNHYSGIAALFSFNVIIFAFFILFLILFAFCRNKDDENSINLPQDANPIITYGFNTARNMIENRNENNVQNQYQENNGNINPEYLIKAICASVILCQMFYLIELILIGVFHYKINAIEIFDCKIFYKNYILKNYRDLIIESYILYFLIFFPIYSIILVLFLKKKTPNPIKFCICFTHNIANCCIFLSDCSKKCHTSEKLRAKNLITKAQIEALSKYRDNLKSMNENWKKGIVPSNKELSNLNLIFK